MPTSTVEDYVKAIYLLQQDAPDDEATVVRLAATLGVTKGSVTAMVRKLRDTGLADAERYGGIRLTPKGRAIAVDMIRRHRLIEVFLVGTLGLDWSEVYEEAHRLEHAMSRRVLDRLDAFLGRPRTDPHGDPIPDAQGRIVSPDQKPLSALAKGEKGTIARIDDHDPSFLEFAASKGLRPGTRIVVVDVVPEAESMSVRASGREPIVLSFSAAGKIHTERA
ncbi:MAG: metal-dependent transcriptional regulator [Planctomycetota bacterium]